MKTVLVLVCSFVCLILFVFKCPLGQYVDIYMYMWFFHPSAHLLLLCVLYCHIYAFVFLSKTDDVHVSLMDIVETGDPEVSYRDHDSQRKWPTGWFTQYIQLTLRTFRQSRTRIMSRLKILESVLLCLLVSLVWFQLPRTEETLRDRMGAVSRLFFMVCVVWIYVRLRSYQHGRTETHVFPSVRGRGCVHTNTDGPGRMEKKWRVQRNRSWCCGGGGGDEGWTRCTLSVDFLCTLLTDRAMCMVNTIIWYQYPLMIRLNLPSTWGWTLTHFTIYWRYKAASELRRSVSHRPCCAFVLVKEKQCTIKVSKHLKSSVPWTDGWKRSCMHVLKKIRPCQYERFSRHQWE